MLGQPLAVHTSLTFYLLLLLLSSTKASKSEENVDLENKQQQLNELTLLENNALNKSDDLLINITVKLQRMLTTMIHTRTKSEPNLDIETELFRQDENFASCLKINRKLILENIKQKGSLETLESIINKAISQNYKLEKNLCSQNENLVDRLFKLADDNSHLKQELNSWKNKYENLVEIHNITSSNLQTELAKISGKYIACNSTVENLKSKLIELSPLTEVPTETTPAQQMTTTTGSPRPTRTAATTASPGYKYIRNHNYLVTQLSPLTEVPTETTPAQQTNTTTGSPRSTPASAPPGYKYITNHNYYKIHKHDEFTWFEARDRCEAEGARLVVINSQDEAIALGGLIVREGTRSRHHWVGAHGIQDVYWLTIYNQTLKDAGYDNWCPGEPDYAPGYGECVSFKYQSEDMCYIDLDCDHDILFICEFLIY